MDQREEYKIASDKIEYFQNLSNEEKIELYKNMTLPEQRELLSVLPFQYIKNFILMHPKEKQQYIYENLNDNQLKAIYNTFNEEEKKNMINALESRQSILNDRIIESRENIQISTSSIEKSNESIENSKTSITNSKETIKEKKQEQKANKIILKKLSKERKQNLKKVMRAKKRLNGRLSRIGIISKYKTKKYMDKLSELEQTNQNIDEQNSIIKRTEQEIKDLKENIEKEKINIEKQEQSIKEEQKNINANVSRIDMTEKQIRKLSNTEKKVFGRKLYNKIILERDCILVRKKKEIKIENEQYKQIERISPDQVEIIEPTHENTELMVNQTIDNANKLQGMGVNFYQPANIIGSTQQTELLQNPIAQLNPQQQVVLTYAMMFYVMLQNKLQQQQQNQDLSNEYTPKSRGSINIILLVSIILFTASLVLFIIK